MNQMKPAGTVYQTDSPIDAIAWIVQKLGLPPDSSLAEEIIGGRYMLQLGAQDVFVVDTSATQ